jgi:DNA invertase Pin-like site-specific DNA recombinase
VSVRAIGYVRVSRTMGREGDSFISPTLQRESIEGLAAREGFEVAEWLEELDASGGDASRPLWNRAIEMVERGDADGIAVWNLARFSRSVRDALNALDRVESAGGRVWSATERTDDKMLRTILLAVAENERERIRAGFAASTASAVARGVHLAAKVPLGYRRGPDKRLVPDPDTAPLVLGVFERRAKGSSWRALARWLCENGQPFSERGVVGLVHNPVYLGQARYGAVTKDDAHEAIVPRGLWRRCQGRGTRSARSGVLTERFLLQGLATCASCGRAMYLAGGRSPRNPPSYVCRRLECGAHAYARAQWLDDFVLNTIQQELTGVDPDGHRVGPGDSERWRAATFVARPGGDDRDVEEAESALEEARADLDEFLEDTKLRRVLGAGRYAEAASDYVAAVNQAEADVEAAREASSGSFELVGRLWNTEWGWAERKEWVERMVRSVTVHRGREPLSERAEVELR